MNEFNRKLGDAVSGGLNALLILAIVIFLAANFVKPVYDSALLLVVAAGAVSGVVDVVLGFLVG